MWNDQNKYCRAIINVQDGNTTPNISVDKVDKGQFMLLRLVLSAGAFSIWFSSDLNFSPTQRGDRGRQRQLYNIPLKTLP